MSEPFVNGLPTREAFESLLLDVRYASADCERNGGKYDYEERDRAEAAVLAAFDAMATHIAELESPAYRARVVREFEAEVDAEWFGESSAPSINGIRTNVLARWESAAKEGK